jgi:predicted Rossmann fold flavoprotein
VSKQKPHAATKADRRSVDVLILGAGASGLMCARGAGMRGRRVVVADHSPRPGAKIRISGGGRCNFTNQHVAADHYISQNPHFVKSALSRFGPQDFINLMGQYNIPYQERALGQLFCDRSAGDIVEMLLAECRKADVEIITNCKMGRIKKKDCFEVALSTETILAKSLVIATGGISFPDCGATDLGYRIARQFDIPIIECKPGLAPLTWPKADRKRYGVLSGISVEAVVTCGGQSFREAVLFTHQGLSGPAILQASNYWEVGKPIQIDLLPGQDIIAEIDALRSDRPKAAVRTLVAALLPKRLVDAILPPALAQKPASKLTGENQTALANAFHHWEITPAGTEGYTKAEVTLGGVDTRAISSKTFEARAVPGLHFIGEVLDITGWLGGYNLHWAWASGFCAGECV